MVSIPVAHGDMQYLSVVNVKTLLDPATLRL